MKVQITSLHVAVHIAAMCMCHTKMHVGRCMAKASGHGMQGWACVGRHGGTQGDQVKQYKARCFCCVLDAGSTCTGPARLARYPQLAVLKQHTQAMEGCSHPTPNQVFVLLEAVDALPAATMQRCKGIWCQCC